MHHKSPKPARSKWKTPQHYAFGFSLTAAWAAIAVLWVITPLSYAYVAWTVITLAPSLAASRPDAHGALGAIHYVFLAYAAFEIPFSLYYRYLAIQANARRPTPQYTRKFLRSVFKRSLENGLNPAEDDLLEVLSLAGGAGIEKGMAREKERANASMRSAASGYNMRQRKAGTPPATVNGDVELNSIAPTLLVNGHPSDDSLVEGGNGDPVRPRLRYVPSFIEKPLTRDDPRAHDFRDFLRLWFNNCEYDEIHRLNMCDWLSWSLYGQPHEEVVAERAQWEKDGKPPIHLDGELDADEDGLDLDGDKLGLVDHCVELVEARSGVNFKEGRNPDVKVIRLTLDPVKVIGRPLILYLFVWCVQKAVIGTSKLHGFSEVKDKDTRYLVRMPRGWTPARDGLEKNRPLLFIHGLGMGLPQYSTLLAHLSKAENLKERPIVVLIQPHISMSFFSPGYLSPPDKDTCTAGIVRIAKTWGFDKSGMTVLSHSNGTIVHGWLLKQAPDLVVRSCFVDPVCFCLWEPYVCFNFLYSKARTPIEYLMRFFVSRELGVALMLQRAFNWSSNLLFPTEIPNLHSPYHSAFYLAGRDSILNASRVRTYLKSHGIKEVKKGMNVGKEGGLKLYAAKAHGESLIGRGRAFEQIMSWVTAEEGDIVSSSSGEDSTN